MKAAKFTNLEDRVLDIAARRAGRELMRVPWGRFCKAYEDYIRWQAFALWVRAVVECEGCTPSWLEAILRKRCPGFAEKAARSNEPELLGLKLLSWVHNGAFGFAKQEGWLDALVFYGFRDARSQGSWEYWEHCESEWKKRRPKSFPTFAEWHRSALSWELDDVPCAAVTKAVEKYLDFEAVVYWLRPLFQAPTIQLPTHVTHELSEECPGLRELVDKHISATYRGKSKSWRNLFSWGKDHVLSHAKKEGWLNFVLRQVSIHPRHVRMADYTRLWCISRADNPSSPHPSFGEWQRDAEGYTRTSRK